MRLVLLILIIFGFLVWFLRFNFSNNWKDQLQEGWEIRFRGSIASQPYQNGSYQVFRVGEFNIKTEAFERYKYGDKLEVVGRLDKVVTKSGSSSYWLMDPSIRLVNQEVVTHRFGVSGVISWIHNLRERISQNLIQALPEPHSSLLLGILLGVRRRLSYEFATALRSTGTMHVVVASGYNLSVVAGVISALLIRVVSRRKAIPFILLGVAFYVVLAAADPPVVRAAIMVSMAFIAQLAGRYYQGLWALAVAAMVMLIIDPFLVFDIGFQLSVAATTGILVITPGLRQIFPKFLQVFAKGLLAELSVTLGAQLAVVPLLLFHFGEVSWLSPLVNLLVLGLVPIIMGLGGIMAVVSFFWQELVQLLGLFAWLPLTVFIEVVQWFAGLPFGRLKLGLSWVWVVLYYAALFLLLWKARIAKAAFEDNKNQ